MFKDVSSEKHTFGFSDLSSEGAVQVRLVPLLSFANGLAVKCFSEELLCPFEKVFGVPPEALGALQLQHLGYFFSFLARLGAPPLPPPFLDPVLASF